MRVNNLVGFNFNCGTPSFIIFLPAFHSWSNQYDVTAYTFIHYIARDKALHLKRFRE